MKAKQDEWLAMVFLKYRGHPEFILSRDKGIGSIDEPGSMTGDTMLHIACQRGVVADVVELLEGGASVHAKGDCGFTPLHYAVRNGHIDILRVLLRAGARVDVKNDWGETPRDTLRHAVARKPKQEWGAVAALIGLKL